MQVRNALLRRRAQIEAMLQNTNSYRDSHQQYLKQIKAENLQILIDVCFVIRQILSQRNYNPLAKLLSLRFIKECIFFATYGFLTFLNSFLCSVLFDYASFKKQSQNPYKGRQLFTSFSGSDFDSQHIKTIGFSFHVLTLEIFMNTAKWVKSCPYHLQSNLPSKIKRSYEKLTSIGTNFPDENKYFHKDDEKKFKGTYVSNAKNIEAIHHFYGLLFSDLKISTKYKETMHIIENIIKSGDMFCAERIVFQIQNLILKEEKPSLNYVELINKLFFIGDIQTIYLIQKQLLALLLKGYNEKKLPYYHTYELSLWGYLIQSVDFPQNLKGSYIKVSQNLKGCNPDEINSLKQNFIFNWSSFKQINFFKKSLMKIQAIDQNIIENVLKPIKDKETPKKGLSLKPDIEEINENWNVSKERQKMKFIVNTDNFNPIQRKSSKKYLSKTQREKRISKCPSFASNLKIDEQINMEKCFEDMKILSKKKVHKKEQVGSCPNFSQQGSQNASRKVNSPFNFYEMKIVNLQEEIKKKDMKEEFLKKIIMEKERKIKQLSQRDCCTPSEQSKQDETPFNTMNDLTLEIQTSLSLKTKISILKKKVLLLKNTEIQVGIITNFLNELLLVEFYITPFINLWNIQTNISVPKWLESKVLKNSAKEFAKAESQFVINLAIQLKGYEDIQELPQFMIEYRRGKQENLLNTRTFIPIFITKFCQMKETSRQEWNQVDKEKNKRKKAIVIEPKICKSFEHFLKYFPKAIYIVERKQYFVKIVFSKVTMYLFVEMVEDRKAIFRLNGHKNRDEEKEEIIFKAYSQILGI